jgi:2-desacetyl-2-hydroxyethyl bacteriochlorophyllide A dehydrogenase
MVKQIKAFGSQDLRVVISDAPDLGADEVIVEMKACGICGSDKWFWEVEEPNDYVAGHEVAGKVLRVGEIVKSLKVGDRVAVNNVKGCGDCEACRKGAFVRCEKPLTHIGFGFSQQLAVPARNCLPLHPDISYEAGSLIFDNWGTPYSALKRTSMKEGDFVVVTGCGPIGLAAVALAKLRGAKVIAIDLVEARLEMAKKMGADTIVTPSIAAEKMKEQTGEKGVDYVIECSGNPKSYDLAFSALAVGGTLVSIGEGAEVKVAFSELIHKHLTIEASLYSTMKDGVEVQDLIVNGDINPMAFVTHRFELDELPDSFGKIYDLGDGILKAIVLNG